jgi:hypothetical protein
MKRTWSLPFSTPRDQVIPVNAPDSPPSSLPPSLEIPNKPVNDTEDPADTDTVVATHKHAAIQPQHKGWQVPISSNSSIKAAWDFVVLISVLYTVGMHSKARAPFLICLHTRLNLNIKPIRRS